MHVIFVPYSLMKVDPASWMKMVTRYKGSLVSIGISEVYPFYFLYLVAEVHRPLPFSANILLV